MMNRRKLAPAASKRERVPLARAVLLCVPLGVVDFVCLFARIAKTSELEVMDAVGKLPSAVRALVQANMRGRA